MRLGVSVYKRGWGHIPPGSVTVEIYMSTLNKTGIFEKLHAHKVHIRSALGFEFPEWQNDPQNADARIRTYCSHTFNLEDENEWPEVFAWLKTTGEKIQQVLTNLDYYFIYA